MNQSFYIDTRDDHLASKTTKQNNALTHFNYFLKTYCSQIGVNTVEANNIPHYGIPKGENNKSIFEFWGKMMGCFFDYMGKDAKVRCDPNGNRLAHGSASQYCSSVKVFFTNKFRDEPIFQQVPVFQENQWKQLKTKLRGKYREGNRALGKRMVEGKASSTREDREAMATGCVWLGTAETAEFWHLLNTQYHCSGRGSEVSLIKPNDLSIVEVNEDVYQYKILQIDVQRQKDGPHQSIAIYPHRDGVFEDFYFSLIYLVVMVGCDTEFLFPKFSLAARKTKGDKSDSKVSPLWTKMCDEIRDTFETLAVRINEKLSSHCNKKGSNQVMAESPSVSGLAQMFRTGWEVRGTDTLFEYICGSFVMSQQAGKAVSGWTAKIGDLIVGGQPPSFDDVEESITGIKRFTNVLFENDTHQRWDAKVRELLVMSLLLRFDQFLNVLETHPDPSPKPVEDPSLRNRFYHDHLFVCRVKQALDRAHIGEVQFDGWLSEARNAFMCRNIPGVPIEKFSLYGVGKNTILMDPRCFVDHFNTISHVVQNMNVNMQRLQHQVSDIRRNQQCERITASCLFENLHKLTKAVERIERHVVGNLPEPSNNALAPNISSVIKFSVSSKALTNLTSIADVTVAFFMDDYPTGYQRDLKDELWSDLPMNERKKLRNLYSTIRRSVRFVLMHVDSFPPKSSPKSWKESLRSVATIAQEQIRERLGFGDKVITIYKLTDHVAIRKLEKSMKLPDDTPEDICKILK